MVTSLTECCGSMFNRAFAVASLQSHYNTCIGATLHQACKPDTYSFQAKGMGKCMVREQLGCSSNIEYNTTGRVEVVLKGCATYIDYHPRAGNVREVNKLHKAVLVSLHLAFLQIDDEQQGRRYKELWDSYVQEEGLAEPTSLRGWWTQLQKWSEWSRQARQRLNLQEMDMLMAQGPHRTMKTHSRAEIGGVPFRAKHLDAKQDSNNSYFFPLVADEASTEDFFVWVGQFCTSIDVVPPWEYTGNSESTLMHFGVTKWCTLPSPAMTPKSNLPLIVSDSFLSMNEENGYKYAVWDLNNVAPTNVAVIGVDRHIYLEGVSYKGRRLTWQTLQVAFPTDWHCLPGYWRGHGYI